MNAHIKHNRNTKKRSGFIIAATLLVLTIGLMGIQPVAINNSFATATNYYAPTERQRRVGKLVSTVFEHSHYRKSSINDPVSSITLDRYLETLDPSRSYFLSSDIKEFEQFRYKLDDAVLTGALEPAFSIYNRLQKRNVERMNVALELLKTEPDFTLDESFTYDRSKTPWCTNTQEMDELWRKRIKNDALSLMLTGKTWAQTKEILEKRYQRALKRAEQTTSDDVFDIFMNTFAHVFDPHSSYLSPRDSIDFRIQMSLSYEGIGASLQLIDDYVTIVNTLPGGSAAASGLVTANDRILAVGEGKSGPLVDVVGWRLDDVVQLIRGKENTQVRLQILPAGAAPGSTEKVITLTRRKITLEAQAAKKDIRTITRGDKTLKVGVVTVPSFYQDYEGRAAGKKDFRSTTRDVQKLITELKAAEVDAIVMDLRGDGGGLLTEATGLSGLFIPSGPIVQLRDTNGQFDVMDDSEPDTSWDGTLVVLVDRFSASASEIFAAAIQDYGRGLIVGQQTYGKGTIQNPFPLDRYAVGKDPGFGTLTITIGKFYRVTGESTQHRGVIPDITLPSAIDIKEIGESTQPSALPWDRVRAVDFKSNRNVKQSITALKQAHQQRILADPDFKLLLKNIDAYEQLRKQTTVSLNLKVRDEERKEMDTSRLKNENERRQTLGLEPLESLEKLAAAESSDATLSETAQIAADLYLLNNHDAAAVTQQNLAQEK